MFPLIVTNTDDTHADAVVEEFNQRGVACHRFNTDRLAAQGSLSWSPEGFWLTESGRVLDAASVTAVLWRRPSPPGSIEMLELSSESLEYAQEETMLVTMGVLRAGIRRDRLWVSHPDSLRRASFKPVQLSEAKELGFRIPKTLVTNEPDEARSFLESLSYKAIAKAAGRGPTSYPFGHGLYTVNLEKKQSVATDAAMDGVRFAPVCFQENIEKSLELRVTCIGRRVFAAALYSQDNEECQDDWRRFSLDSSGRATLRHEPFELPTDVEQRCISMLESWSLNFGCFDFILTPAGEYVFLEVNVNGQFLWIEDLLPEFKMVKAWADLLTGLGKPIYFDRS